MQIHSHHHSSYKIRLVVALLMLALGFIGVILTDVKTQGAWDYWRFLAVIYALLSLGLNWYLRKKEWKTTAVTLWHEIAHWAGMIAAIFVVSYFVKIGIMSRFEASLIALLLLALASYLAGLYIEPTLLLIGLVLGIFAVGIAFLDEYLYNILLPVTVVAALVLLIVFHQAHKKLTKM